MLIVPGRPSAQALLWWVWSDADVIPAVTISGPAAGQSHLRVLRLGEAGDPLVARRAYVVIATNLQADAAYTLEAVAGNDRAQAASRTFPPTLEPGRPFTMAFGSCFSLPTNRGIDVFYPPARHRADGEDPIRLRICCGDQLYMDMSSSSGTPLFFETPEPWQRYRAQWHDLAYATFLRQSPTLMLADDHEFWNDYPHGNAWLPWAESRPGGPLGMAMERAFDVFQAALNLDPDVAATIPEASLRSALAQTARTFEIRVDPLRLCCLDTRTRRSRYDAPRPQFTDPLWLTQAMQWLRAAPGVRILCMSQAAIEERASWFARLTHTLSDANLPDYDHDFAALWEALAGAPTDRLVVAGDIHWSRLYQARQARGTGAEVYEVMASPLARIPGGAPATGEPTGKVEWERPGGRAHWTRRYATNAAATYTTLTFRVRSGGPQPDVEVSATVWGIPPSRAQGAIPLCQDTFFLRGAMV
jgi:hypothetical protein